jgi:hypothetical protein
MLPGYSVTARDGALLKNTPACPCGKGSSRTTELFPCLISAHVWHWESHMGNFLLSRLQCGTTHDWLGSWSYRAHSLIPWFLRMEHSVPLFQYLLPNVQSSMFVLVTLQSRTKFGLWVSYLLSQCSGISMACRRRKYGRCFWCLEPSKVKW